MILETISVVKPKSLNLVVICCPATRIFVILNNFSIPNLDNSSGMLRDILFMSNKDNGSTLFLVKLLKGRKNLLSCFSIKIASWFIREN